jgi:hypothetical protein
MTIKNFDIKQVQGKFKKLTGIRNETAKKFSLVFRLQKISRSTHNNLERQSGIYTTVVSKP